MKGIRRLAPLVAVFLIAACVSQGLYRPATSARGTGYSEQRLETNRWRVTFTGGPSTPAGMVQDFALLRAADLTLSMGYEWFIVAGRQTATQDSGYGPRFSGVWGPPCGRFGCRSAIYGGFWYDDYDQNRLSASLDIVMGRGPKPPDANAYDARDVANTIRSRSSAGY
ncbi:MAG: hypothetical protein WAW96_21555 [Alphaproteobacteria bacterium]